MQQIFKDKSISDQCICEAGDAFETSPHILLAVDVKEGISGTEILISEEELIDALVAINNAKQ